MTRRVLGPLLIAIALAAAGQAFAAPTGPYQGTVDGSPAGPPVCGVRSNEGEGWFRVKGSGAAQRLVDPGSFACRVNTKITAPAWGFECNQVNVVIPHSIPLRNNAFDFSGKLPVGRLGSNRFVRFKGHYDSSTRRFVGFTRIVGKSCDSGKLRWHMKRVS